MLDLIIACAPAGVAPTTVQAVIHIESSGNPYAVHVNGDVNKSKYFDAQTKAIAYAEQAVNSGKSVDMGLMQVNSMHLKTFQISVGDLFDACTNIKYGTKILADCFRRASKRVANKSRAFVAALSCYNTGRFSGANGRQYAYKVFRRYFK